MRVWQAALAALAAGLMTAAIEPKPEPDAGVRAHSFDVLLRRLDQYVFPDKAAAVRPKLVADCAAYLAQPNTASFIRAINADLFAASRDGDLQLFLHDGQPAPADRAAANYGTARAQKLQNGVGLIEITGFSTAPASAAAIDACRLE